MAHECPTCMQICYCDGEDHDQPAPADCSHWCDPEDDDEDCYGELPAATAAMSGDDDMLPRTLVREYEQRPAMLIEQGWRKPLVFTYRNHRGEVAERRCRPRFVWFGATEWHPEPQWLLNGYDLDKMDAEREFAMRDMTNVRHADS